MIAQTSTPPALTLPRRSPRTTPRTPARAENAGPRFTTDGSPELEAHLAHSCDRIAAGIRGLVPRGRLEAILLGGGYGRGEGGVLRTPTGDRPYNDLEFYVCLQGNRHLNEARLGRALHVLGEILTPQVGVEVEFKITSLGEMARSGISMFSYDLALGHRWLVGREDLLAACAHHRVAEKIPLSEATRLLMNRCTGLLFAQERLMRREFTAADADFVRRNLGKAQLALGDAVLVNHGQYHWSVRERNARLNRLAANEKMPWLEEICRHHAVGVEFKLHPERCTEPRDALRERYAPLAALAEKIWLWLERRRIGTLFGSARDYALSAPNKWPESSPARNMLVNLKVLGVRPLLRACAGCHPRERVLHALCLLLWEPATLTSPELLECVQSELQTDAKTFPDLVRAYRDLWSKVN
ncbi:MAG TPA: hypothetical protein VM029_18890 [Opitutaceae bacterium]|nr:hypothetical protein [Opitutaceae bacterium]